VDSKSSFGRVNKQSEQVFLTEVTRAQAESLKASRIYHALSKSTLAFGIAFALVLALPLMTVSKQTEPKGAGQYETNNYFNAQPGGGEPLKLEAVIKNEFEYAPHSHEPGVAGARINVAGPNIVIRAVPPLNKEWHRSVFEKEGDSLWALPDVDLVIRLSENLSRCPDAGCEASFDLESRQFLRGTVEKAVSFSSAGPVISDSLKSRVANTGHCDLENRRPEVTKCLLNDQGGDRSVCLWLRRSTFPGRVDLPEVALDVKWDVREFQRSECIDRLNETPYRER
jgi:hypothetical protein